MPYSSFIFDKEIAQVIKSLSPSTFLDIGAGAGKYGEMVKAIKKETKTTAIEIEKDYIKRFSLKKLYDSVWNMSAIDLLLPKHLDKTFDVVMIGDIIEHLKKSDGIDLINFLIYRAKWIIIEFPFQYIQNSVDGYISEAHISAWDMQDFEIFERTQLYTRDKQKLIILKGYLEDITSIKDIEKILAV